MNLNAIAGGVVSAVLPQTPLSIQVSTGYTTTSSGKRVSSYAAPVTVMGSVQAMTSADLMQYESINIEKVTTKILINGQVNGLVRATRKGGDLITTPDGSVWLVTNVFEDWPDWCCVGVTLQNGA